MRLTVMMYVRYPLSLRQVEDLLFERGIDICHETVQTLPDNHFGFRLLTPYSRHITRPDRIDCLTSAPTEQISGIT